VKRREFITLLGGAAAAWPLAVRAQQPERMRLIGILLSAAAGDTVFEARLAAFHQELALLGWIIGRNVRIDLDPRRWQKITSDYCWLFCGIGTLPVGPIAVTCKITSPSFAHA
jgi:putative ABC transport system substrate-binding protein